MGTGGTGTASYYHQVLPIANPMSDVQSGYSEYQIFTVGRATTFVSPGVYQGLTRYYNLGNLLSTAKSTAYTSPGIDFLAAFAQHRVQYEIENTPSLANPVGDLNGSGGQNPEKDFSGRGAIMEIRSPGQTTPIAFSLVDVTDGVSVGCPAPGTYDFSIKPEGCLRETLSAVVTSTVATIDSFTYRYGDINGDNSVDLLDYFALSDSYNKTSTDADWNVLGVDLLAPVNSDLNGDGTVDLLDYFLMSDSMNEVGDD